MRKLALRKPRAHSRKSRPVPKTAYLTFDDGPNLVTNLILDVLARNKVKGTFFMLEPLIRRFPKTVRRMVREGHAVGLHGVTHKVSQFYASKQSVIREFNDTRNTLKKVTGKDTVLVRTPYGSLPHMRPSYFKAVRHTGYRLWDWNVDSRDWKHRNERLVYLVKKGVLELEKSGSRPVILMHDLPVTARLLPRIIRFLKNRDYRLKKLDSSLTPVQL